MTGWERKAHRLIAQYARASWLQNKRKPGYSLPDIACALVAALGMHDRKAAEHEAKRLFHVESVGAWTQI